MSSQSNPDFVLLHPDGQLSYGRRRPDEGIFEAIRAVFGPGMSTQGMGVMRAWHWDQFTADMPDNHLANAVIERLGYQHPTGWCGLVVLTMEEDRVTHEVPPLSDEATEAFDHLAARARPHHAS